MPVWARWSDAKTGLLIDAGVDLFRPASRVNPRCRTTQLFRSHQFRVFSEVAPPRLPQLFELRFLPNDNFARTTGGIWRIANLPHDAYRTIEGNQAAREFDPTTDEELGLFFESFWDRHLQQPLPYGNPLL